MFKWMFLFTIAVLNNKAFADQNAYRIDLYPYVSKWLKLDVDGELAKAGLEFIDCDFTRVTFWGNEKTHQQNGIGSCLYHQIMESIKFGTPAKPLFARFRAINDTTQSIFVGSLVLRNIPTSEFRQNFWKSLGNLINPWKAKSFINRIAKQWALTIEFESPISIQLLSPTTLGPASELTVQSIVIDQNQTNDADNELNTVGRSMIFKNANGDVLSKIEYQVQLEWNLIFSGKEPHYRSDIELPMTEMSLRP